MPKTPLQNLVKSDCYQIFVLSCPVLFFGRLITHNWFVSNKKGVLARWEVVHWKATGRPYIKENLFAPFQGLPIIYTNTFPIFNKFTQPVRLLGALEGGENSLASKIITFIEDSPKTYPYRDYYKFLGPNSNTYAQWVLDEFPEFKITLPFSALGKNFEKA